MSISKEALISNEPDKIFVPKYLSDLVPGSVGDRVGYVLMNANRIDTPKHDWYRVTTHLYQKLLGNGILYLFKTMTWAQWVIGYIVLPQLNLLRPSIKGNISGAQIHCIKLIMKVEISIIHA